MTKPETLTRAASATSSLDVEARTVDVVFASETPVRRYDWETGYYDEILLCGPENVDLARAGSMSVLDSHNDRGLANRLGQVVPGSIRFERNQVLATIQLSRNTQADAILKDLVDGQVLPISAGYRVNVEQRQEAERGGVAVVTATRWTPLELSIVAVPADPAARTRALEAQEEAQMTSPNTETEQRQVRPDTVRERTRIKELRHLARSAHISDDELDRAIDDGTDIEAFRSRAFEVMVARESQTPTFPHVETNLGGNGQMDQHMRARQDALVARMTGAAPEGDARHFAADTLLDHARGLLEAQGVNTRGMSREEIFGQRARSYAMHTTSDFPNLLQGAGERVLQEAYQAARSPLTTTLSRRTTANDFRAKSTLKISEGGLLEKVTEAGEITAMTRAEAAESYRIHSYARVFAMSFQALVNDDLGAFADWSTQAGQMAGMTENKVLLDLLLSGGGAGPLMGEDNKALFHADHGNLAAAGTALDETSLAAAFLAFRKQKTLGGHRMMAAPRYLLTGPDLELTAQKLVATITPNETDKVVPEGIRNLVPVVEPNLDGKAWYLFGDPSAAPVLEHAFLAGHEGVKVDTRDGFERLGTEFRAVLHFGAGAVDFRGAYRNPGL